MAAGGGGVSARRLARSGCVRSLLALLLVLAGARPVFAEASINAGFDMGGVIGHGPLTARLDPVASVGADATVTLGRWMLDAGIVLMTSDGGAPAPSARLVRSRRATDAPEAPDLEAFGWTATLRRHGSTSALGASFIGLGFSELGLRRIHAPYAHAGRAWGPRLVAGLDLVGNAKGRRFGLVVSATYQWLVAKLDDGRHASGGFAGLELTLLTGWGSCRNWTSTHCGGRF